MTLKYHASDVDERARIQAWHRTFDAVLSGVMARPLASRSFAVREAFEIADAVHGSIAVATAQEESK